MWPVGWSFGSDSFFLLLLPALQREEGEGIPSTNREAVLQILKWRTTSAWEYKFVLVPPVSRPVQILTLTDSRQIACLSHTLSIYKSTRKKFVKKFADART